ncbi:MAG: sigma factor-like helix-turn-helix DNA-binding protein [Sphaerochaetaceae bacterium]|nr:sigma factor-like helix-turn-helix DNA-binding protein [Sphaerochaetaceae bacterium]
MELQEKLRLNQLFDIYGELLTEKQRVYYEYYYLKDYSLAEIAEILNVSRNAVHMQLKSVLAHLQNYEDKIGMLNTKKNIKKIITKINDNNIDINQISKELEKV